MRSLDADQNQFKIISLRIDLLLLSSPWLPQLLELLELGTRRLDLLPGPRRVPRCWGHPSSSRTFQVTQGRWFSWNAESPPGRTRLPRSKGSENLIISSCPLSWIVCCFGGGSFSVQNGTCDQREGSNCQSQEGNFRTLEKRGNKKMSYLLRMGTSRGRT